MRATASSLRRVTRLLTVLLAASALAAPAAHAQSNPFGPLPQTQAPAATPPPAPTPAADQGSVSRPLLFGIAGGVLLLFVGIGMYISRDARSHLTDGDRRAVEREGGRERERVDAQRLRGEQVKKKARAKTKAQRQARKRQRQRSGR